MLKVKNERAWVVQAIFDPVSDTCIKCLWVGSSEVCRSASAKILDNGTRNTPPTIEFGDEDHSYVLNFPVHDRQRPRQRLNSNFFMEGIVCPKEMASVVSGEGDFLYDQAFSVLKSRCDVPLLREWMPEIFEAGLSSGSIIKMEVAGMAVPANQHPIYHIKMYETAIKELLLKQLPVFAAQAEKVIKAQSMTALAA